MRDTDRQEKSSESGRRESSRRGRLENGQSRPATGRAAGQQMDQSVKDWKPQAEKPTRRKKKKKKKLVSTGLTGWPQSAGQTV